MTNRWRTFLLAAAAGALLSLGGATTVEARPNRNCSAKIDRERNKLERDIRRFGFFSRQAQRQREKVDRLREQCRGYGFFGRDRDRDDRRWERRDRDRDDRRGQRDRDDWYWDGRRWRRR